MAVLPRPVLAERLLLHRQEEVAKRDYCGSRKAITFLTFLSALACAVLNTHAGLAIGNSGIRQDLVTEPAFSMASLWPATVRQTPQLARIGKLAQRARATHRSLRPALAGAAGGGRALPAISSRTDVAEADRFSAEEWGGTVEPPMRIGHGFDIHRYAPRGDPEDGGPVVIGGVVFKDFEMGIVAHSDGDVVYHSVVDAIFGALTLPDIGQFFPDTDPRWKAAPSNVFMEEAWRQMDMRGYRVGNIDVTIIAQAPRMMVKDHPLAEPGKPFDHKLKMIDNVADLLKCPKGRVNVKARTHEKVDAVGEKRAISCHVVAVLEHFK